MGVAALLALLGLACADPGGDGAGAERGAPPSERLSGPVSVIVVYCDDLRHDVLEAPLDFPAMRRVADGGVRFERSYVTTSRCCPGRATMLTGRPMSETGVRNNHPERFPDLPTIAEVGQGAGYRTAWFGKWHLPNPGAKRAPGFDEWAAYEGPGAHFDQVFVDETGDSFVAEGHQADWIFARAERFLEENQERPFLLFVAPKNPHTPMTPAPRHAGAADGVDIVLPESYAAPDEALPRLERALRARRHEKRDTAEAEAMLDVTRRYWELVLAVDEGVARLDRWLEAHGRSGSTLVLITSDNGQMLGEHGLVQKGLAYEPSIRVPLIARWPARLPVGATVDSFALNLDLFPTLARAMGADAAARDAPGLDLVAIARGETPGRESFVYEAPDFGGRSAIRAVVEERWKYIRWSDPDDEALFDLGSDADETVNLAADPAHAPVLDRLRAKL